MLLTQVGRQGIALVARLKPNKLHVKFSAGASPVEPLASRCYTLTHSDTTGELFLTIGLEFDRAQISGLYTRFMRDEVLAEWRDGVGGPALHVYCHVSGGLVFGPARLRDAIFRRELPLVLEAFHYGDRRFLEARPELGGAPLLVHFRSRRRKYRRVERWGTLSRYRVDAE
jgi:hypothetical protein